MDHSADLQRFVEAQADAYDQALAELKRGRKATHWMWFVFPQIAGLGHSEMARRYAIADLDEARRFISEEVLANPNTLHKVAPEILLNSVNTTGYDLKVLFWINNIRQEQVLKSELLASIYHRLTEAGITMR